MTKPVDPAIRLHPLDDLDLRHSDLRLPSPKAVARIRQAIEQEGMRNPILVSSGVAAGQLVVIDGHKRVQAARELGHTQVLVHVVDLDPVAAQVAILQANAAHRGLCDVEEGLIVQRLHRDHGLSQVEIGALLGRHRSWVCRRLSLVERLESAVQDDLRLGLTSASVARELAQLPRGTQVPAARAVAAHALSTRQTAQLVRVLRLADPRQRVDILERPLQHLPAGRGEERYPSDPRLGAAGNRVRQSLLRIEASSHRLLESFRSRGPGSFRPAEAGILAELGERVLPTTREALAGVERLLSSTERRVHVGS